jgi:ABC-2 type transport system ATP-binding protein
MDKIILKSVTKKIKGVTILENINLEFQQGKIYGLCGYNGSGKTMLLRMIAGLIRPTEGEVLIGNKLLHKDIDFPESIGVLIETPNFWSSYTGREVLYSLARIKNIIGMEEIDDALRRVNLIPDDMRVIKKYSLGMKQRLGIAQAIMEKPEILLLDEPSNALDKKSVDMVRSIIEEEKDRGAIVILASHNVDDLDVCDFVIEIEEGRIIEGDKHDEKE